MDVQLKSAGIQLMDNITKMVATVVDPERWMAEQPALAPAYQIAESGKSADEVVAWLTAEVLKSPRGGFIIPNDPQYTIDEIADRLEQFINRRLDAKIPTLVGMDALPLIDIQTALPRALLDVIYRSISNSYLERRLPDSLILMLLFTYAVSVGQVSFTFPNSDLPPEELTADITLKFGTAFAGWTAGMEAKYGKKWFIRKGKIAYHLIPVDLKREPAKDEENLFSVGIISRMFEEVIPLLYSADTERYIHMSTNLYLSVVDMLESANEKLGCLLFLPIKLVLVFTLWIIRLAEGIFKLAPHLVPDNVFFIKRKLRLMFATRLDLAGNPNERSRRIRQLLSLFQCTRAVYLVFADPESVQEIQNPCKQ
jgi:hypothetical protein